MYRKTEALAVHGAKIMQNLEFTKNGKTILFYQNEGDAKYRFKIKDDADLTHWLLLNTKTHRIREDKIKYAVKGIFEKLKEVEKILSKRQEIKYKQLENSFVTVREMFDLMPCEVKITYKGKEAILRYRDYYCNRGTIDFKGSLVVEDTEIPINIFSDIWYPEGVMYGFDQEYEKELDLDISVDNVIDDLLKEKLFWEDIENTRDEGFFPTITARKLVNNEEC